MSALRQCEVYVASRLGRDQRGGEDPARERQTTSFSRLQRIQRIRVERRYCIVSLPHPDRLARESPTYRRHAAELDGASRLSVAAAQARPRCTRNGPTRTRAVAASPAAQDAKRKRGRNAQPGSAGCHGGEFSLSRQKRFLVRAGTIRMRVRLDVSPRQNSCCILNHLMIDLSGVMYASG